MTRVMLDAQMREKLLGLAHPVDLCDESGKVLGTFTPLTERDSAERARPAISVDELARRRMEPDYSTEELISRLENL